MSDYLFGDSEFLQHTGFSIAILLLYMVLSFIPSMFQVSSYLLFDFGKIFDQHEYWRLFTAVFSCNHPDKLILIIFLVYYSRQAEYKLGELKFLFLMLLNFIFSNGLFLLLGVSETKFDYFYGEFLLEYCFAFPVSLACSTLILIDKMNMKFSENIKFNNKIGIILLILLCYIHRLTAASAAASLCGTISGVILGLIFKRFL